MNEVQEALLNEGPSVVIVHFSPIIIVLETKSKKNRVRTTAAVKYKGDWNNLPDLLLENVFSFLNAGEKHNASTTCWSWYSAFHYPYSWHTFVFDDTTLTRRKFNYYSGWQVSWVQNSGYFRVVVRYYISHIAG